jgi:UPF0755 protein
MMMSDEDTERTDVIQPQHHYYRRKPRWGRIIALIIVLIAVIFGFFCLHIHNSLQPIQKNEEKVIFTVADNSTSKQVIESLASQGIIKDGTTAYYYARLFEMTDFKAGNFELDKSWTLDQIFQTLSDNSSASANSGKVTIVEGDWAKDCAAKFAEVTNVKAADLIALWSNKEWIESEMSKYPFLTEEMFGSNVRIYLEGYLAPETYIVSKETTAEEITEKVLDQTLTVYEKNQTKIAASKLSIHQIYTLASIVQYEGGGDLETLKNISSVFYNRLNIDMPLQSSVTVCYAIDFDKQVDQWQACEVNSEFDSPYNTYKYTGLPPGAIENAGTSALEAVLSPNDTNYLYFMAEVKTGNVYYASTYEEHLKNIADHPNN